MKKTYYIRIKTELQPTFEATLTKLEFDFSLIGMDSAGGEFTCLYSVEMDANDVLLLKLSFPVKQCITLSRID